MSSLPQKGCKGRSVVALVSSDPCSFQPKTNTCAYFQMSGLIKKIKKATTKKKKEVTDPHEALATKVHIIVFVLVCENQIVCMHMSASSTYIRLPGWRCRYCAQR
jgi:hypothetical protein